MTRCWVCEKGEIVHVRRKEPTCNECGQYFMDGEMSAYEAGQRRLVEEAARWLDDNAGEFVDPGDGEWCGVGYATRQLLEAFRKRFGPPEETP